ncbi:response regulator receiver modulated CheB methylesterase [Gluconacetobacter diazotrophicus PA1 5]|uniref:chemotaxis protein CheB n=1 Tax=Gluconacetobacter diazotrophicus TaxID=33996 RepID=UPI000173B294|nr:chemotaxis protein CheB [Gluconacetobacter diazotrophicus]ACI52809.1 response regulator receiver modulated CheB methylesterase [Gluconacetobacter diazotrophicus PA1 5]TWB09046.1 two-component system chemotaxis response regulator CheB [Gluconacetobacter diazotrophicus]
MTGGRASRPARVLVVEDSAVVRHVLVRLIRDDPRLELADSVETAEEALRLVPRLRPDVISMDVRLPGMDGLEATRRIMAECPTPIVIVSDASADPALQVSMNALRAGALSVVEKPAGWPVGAAGGTAIATQLYIMSQVPVIRQRLSHGPAAAAAATLPLPRLRPRMVGMAASTGGPQALSHIMGALPATFPWPILLVQHMGAGFMEGFAAWLGTQTKLSVSVARPGEALRPGHVHVAPADTHLMLGCGDEIRLSNVPPLGGQRPSANALFASLAREGAGAIGILLTGMGEDGATGLKEVRRAGGYTIAEDRSTSIVHGMPGAAERIGAASISLPLGQIAPHLAAIATATSTLAIAGAEARLP